MPPRDDEPRRSSPIEPRPADEGRGRFRPKMGRRARDRLASGSPGIARLVLAGHGKRRRSRAPVRALAADAGAGRHARRVVIQAHVHRLRGGGERQPPTTWPTSARRSGEGRLAGGALRPRRARAARAIRGAAPERAAPIPVRGVARRRPRARPPRLRASVDAPGGARRRPAGRLYVQGLR